MKKIKTLLVLIVIGGFVFGLSQMASADSLLGVGQIIPEECAGKNVTIGSCNLNSVFKLIVNIATVIVALTGSAALLMFAYGGAMFILAAGQAERISKAKEILKMAIIGLIIILGSWLIVNAVILSLTEGQIGRLTPATIFGNRPFYQEPQVETEASQ